MARDENAVMYAVEQVCGLYGVQVTREQSRVLNVQTGGRWRPMYFGTWIDDLGQRHTGGKADFLARPRVRVDNALAQIYISVPLWIECKSREGKGNRKTKLEQALFQQWVEKNGDTYLELREDVRPLMAWFEEHGVVRHCDDIELANVVTPMDASELYKLPCRWCDLPRDKHPGPMFSCPLHLKANDAKLLGKVWSPSLKKASRA